MKGNKEESRPHYYCFQDDIDEIIPLSSKIEKYKHIMEMKKVAGKRCDTIHIAKLANDQESAFLIQDIFSTTEKYIEREYKKPK